MLRLIHQQTVAGPIVVDDIDDGLPNKEVHRLGSTADPKAYERDGYANKPKQPNYVPRTKIGDATVAGYIDLDLTPRVVLSNGKGKIFKLASAGLITKTSFLAAQVAPPTLATADLGNPGAGDLTLTGTIFVSLAPELTTVILSGTGGDQILTAAAIIFGGGSVGATSIVIPAALIPGRVIVTSFAQVRANAQLTAVVALS